MSVTYMNQVNISKYEPTISGKLYNYKDSLSSPGNGDAVLIPQGSISVQVGMNISTGNGKIQTTLDPVEDVIEDDTAVTWVDWDSGNVTVNTQDVVSPPTAIRQVNVSGTTEMVLVVHRGN